MLNISLPSMAVAMTRAVIPTIAKRPLMISASSVKPSFMAGKYPKPFLLRSAMASKLGWLGSKKSESPHAGGQIVAISDTPKKCALAKRIMARSLVMVVKPEVVANVPHVFKSNATSASGIKPCPLA